MSATEADSKRADATVTNVDLKLEVVVKFLGAAPAPAEQRDPQRDAVAAAALKDPHADWVYARSLPTRDEVARVHAAGKRLFLVAARVETTDGVRGLPPGTGVKL